MYANRLLPPVSGFLMLLLLCGFHTDEANYTFPLDSYRALSGTFGELRSNHYHSGIDLKTGGKSGATVRAIQDGYVFRIKVSPYGYGNALYLRHPDGNFSVYGHLSKFSSKVESFLRNKQYTSKKFAQDLYLAQDEILFAKGDLIAYSGNSGGSLGPHLHFEIRDPQERIMNPLRWYRNSISDTRPPVLQNIGIEPLDKDSRVNGEFDKLVIKPSGSDGRYQSDQVLEINGRVGIEYQAYDLLNAAGNHCGINYATLYLDDQVVHEFTLDRYAFDEKRFINVHFDYGYYQDSRRKMQRAYLEPGNRFPANRPILDQGLIHLQDGQVHQLRLELTDFHGNTTTFNSRVRRGDRSAFPNSPSYYQTPVVETKIKRNVLVITAKRAHATYRGGLIMETIYGNQERILPAYMKGPEMVFLVALDRYRFPTNIHDEIGFWSKNFHLREELLPIQNNLVEFGDLQLFVPFRSVFNRVPLEIESYQGQSNMYSDIFRIGQRDIPVLEPFLVSIKPPEDWTEGTLVVARKDGNKWEYIGSTIGEDGLILGSSLMFGEFCLMEDSKGPTIRPVNFTNNGTFSSSQDRIKLTIRDEFAGIDHHTVSGTIDGNWVLFEYDYKRDAITYLWDRRPAPGWHTLAISVRDEAGNLSESEYRVRF